MEITRLTEMSSGGSTVAYVDFFIREWGLHLRGCRVVKNNHGHLFIAFPSKAFQRGDEQLYSPFVKFEPDVNKKFQESAIKAVNDYRSTR